MVPGSRWTRPHWSSATCSGRGVLIVLLLARCGSSAGSRTTSPRTSDGRAAIEIENVTKHFKLNQERAALGQGAGDPAGRNPYTTFWALRRRHVRGAQGETLGAARPQRLGQVDAAQVRRRHHAPDHRAHRHPGPDRRAARARLRLPPRPHRPREHLHERVDPRVLQGDRPDLRRHRRVLRDRRVHRQPGEALLVGHGRPARASRSRSTSSPRSCSSTRCCRSATRRSSASASSASSSSSARAARSCSSPTRSTSVRQICDRAAVLDHGDLVAVGDAGRGHPHLPRDAQPRPRHRRLQAAPSRRRQSTRRPASCRSSTRRRARCRPRAAEVAITTVEIEYPDPDATVPPAGPGRSACASTTTPPA